MLISVEEAKSAALMALQRSGVSPAHADLQVNLLLEADLRGRASHGLMRLPRVIERIRNGVSNPDARGIHVWRGNLLEVDGQDGLGPVVACAALDAMEVRLPAAGVTVAAIRNNNHLGMLAWYAERMAARGIVLVATCTSEALVHPWGGRWAMLGTNPLAIGVPTAGDPFVLDMATSLVSMGQIHDYALRGQPIPPGWALDASGDPTTDATAAKAGSIAPFGEAKGYALGLALEVLVAALTGSAIGRDVVGTLDSDRRCNKGDLFILIDPGSAPEVLRAVSSYLDAVRASGSPGKSVAVPGDRALASRRGRLIEGITLSDETWRRIRAFAGLEATHS